MKKLLNASIISCICAIMSGGNLLYAEDDKQTGPKDVDSLVSEIQKEIQKNLLAKLELKFKNSIYIAILKDEDGAIYILEWEDGEEPIANKKFRVPIDELESRLKKTAENNKDRLRSVIISADEDVTYGKIRTILRKYERAVFNVSKINPMEIHYSLVE